MSRRADIRTGYGTSRFAAPLQPAVTAERGPSGIRSPLLPREPEVHVGVGRPVVQCSRVVYDGDAVVGCNGERGTGVRSCVLFELGVF